MNNFDEAYYQYLRQKEIVDSWQKHDYIKKLYDNLRFELVKINWTKANYRALQKYSMVQNQTTYKLEFYKYIEEIDNIIRKLKLVDAYTEIRRANKIKKLTLILIGKIK